MPDMDVDAAPVGPAGDGADNIQFSWLDDDAPQQVHDFQGEPGIRAGLFGENVTEREVYCSMFPEAVFESMTANTNSYARQVVGPLQRESRVHKWIDTSVGEMKVFWG